MHRNASSRVLPGLVLAVLVATLTLVGAASATAGAPHPQPPGSKAATDVPALHHEATVHRGTAVAAQPLPVHQPPVTALTGPPRAASPRLVGIGSGLSPAAGHGAEAVSTIQGRAPPAAVR